MISPATIRAVSFVGLLSLASGGVPRRLLAQEQPMAPAVKTYLRQFVDKLREFRVGRDDMDWGQIEAKTLAAAAGAQTITDAYPAIRTALAEIRDPWAMYRSATGQVIGPDLPRCVRSSTTAPTVPADVHYLRLTPIANRGLVAERQAAMAMRNALKTADDNGALHWVVDLRGHFMGSMPSAVIGLAPLMGEGTVFKMQHANNSVPFNANESSIKADGAELQMNLGKFRLSGKKRRIALLVDGGTAGVGELLMIAFLGRSDVRVFGTTTCGIPPMRLVPQKLKDGAEVSVTSFLVQDRDGRVYRGPIEPQERIENEAELFSRALAWVANGK
jgi:carboxyl-terminal processing protease